MNLRTETTVIEHPLQLLVELRGRGAESSNAPDVTGSQSGTSIVKGLSPHHVALNAPVP